jgi:hypothetical protein
MQLLPEGPELTFADTSFVSLRVALPVASNPNISSLVIVYLMRGVEGWLCNA